MTSSRTWPCQLRISAGQVPAFLTALALYNPDSRVPGLAEWAAGEDAQKWMATAKNKMYVETVCKRSMNNQNPKSQPDKHLQIYRKREIKWIACH